MGADPAISSTGLRLRYNPANSILLDFESEILKNSELAPSVVSESNHVLKSFGLPLMEAPTAERKVVQR